MKRKLVLTYDWWLDGYKAAKDIPTEQQESLEAHALARASQKISMGFREGELYFITNNDWAFRGYWQYKLETIKD